MTVAELQQHFVHLLLDTWHDHQPLHCLHASRLVPDWASAVAAAAAAACCCVCLHLQEVPEDW
jgi:hypothetical protein